MWECKYCGTKADSKCVSERTVFPDDQYEALLTHVLKVDYEPATDVNQWPRLKLSVIDFDEDPDKSIRERTADLLESLTKWLRDPRFNPRQYACDHRWVHTGNGICELGHTHERKEAQK